MSLLPPIQSPAPGTRVAQPPVGKPDDWCGTPIPGRPEPTMPPIHPTMYLLDRVGNARQAMLDATTALRPVRPMYVPENGLPELPQPNLRLAAQHAERGLTLIDESLGLSHMVSGHVRSALLAAQRDARAGHMMVTAKTLLPVNPSHPAASFDSSANFLSIAEHLIRLEHGPIVLPVEPVEPIGILPVDLPVTPLPVQQ